MIVTTQARDIIFKNADREDSNDKRKHYLINLSYDDSIIFDYKAAKKAVYSDHYSIGISK